MWVKGHPHTAEVGDGKCLNAGVVCASKIDVPQRNHSIHIDAMELRVSSQKPGARKMRKTLSIVTMLAMLLVQSVVPAFGWSDFAKALYSKVSEQQSTGVLGSLLPSTLMGTPAPPPPCSPGVMTLSGNSATSGAAGNIRTFSLGSVGVKASGFSRKYSDNSWATAYLGAYSEGLGVTDGSEDGNNGTHRVDNIGSGNNRRNNYVLFE